MAISPSVQNYSVFQGSVSFTPTTATGGGDLGDVSQFRYSADVTNLDHFSHHSGIRTKDKSVVIQTAATITMICDEITDFNLSLYVLADAAASMGGLTNTDLVGQLTFTGTNSIGSQVSFTCQAQFKPGGNIDLIAQGNDWSGIPLTADVLLDSGSYGTWTVQEGTA